MLPGSSARVDASDADNAPEDLAGWLDEMGTTIGEAFLDVGDDIEHIVEGSVETVGEVMEESVDLLHDTFGGHRRVWEDEDVHHAQIEIRGVAAPGN